MRPFLLLFLAAPSIALSSTSLPDDDPAQDEIERVPIDHEAEEGVLDVRAGTITVPAFGNGTRRLAYRPGLAYRLDRVFDFISGDYRFSPRSRMSLEPAPIGPSDFYARHHVNLSSGPVPSPWENGEARERVKRQRFSSTLRSPKALELMVYVDEDMHDLYRVKYKQLAEKKIQTFVGVMLNTTKSLYQHSSLTPRLDINVVGVQIWKRNPRVFRKVGSNGLKYVEEFCNYIRPKSSGFDHATLISGKRLEVGLDIDGIAWQDSVCSDASCTVVRGAFNTAYRHGNTLAHEMGHSLGMAHDGQGPSDTCDPACCIMAPKQTGTTW